MSLLLQRNQRAQHSPVRMMMVFCPLAQQVRLWWRTSCAPGQAKVNNHLTFCVAINTHTTQDGHPKLNMKITSHFWKLPLAMSIKKSTTTRPSQEVNGMLIVLSLKAMMAWLDFHPTSSSTQILLSTCFEQKMYNPVHICLTGFPCCLVTKFNLGFHLRHRKESPILISFGFQHLLSLPFNDF